MKNRSGNFIASSLDAIGKILHRSSAVGPVLVVILALSFLCGVGLICSSKQPSLISLAYDFFYLLAVPVVAFVGVFIYLSFKNPRALQSEHLQITMRQMDLAVASKGQAPEITVYENETSSIEEGSNTKQLEVEATTSTTSVANAIKEA